MIKILVGKEAKARMQAKAEAKVERPSVIPPSPIDESLNSPLVIENSISDAGSTHQLK